MEDEINEVYLKLDCLFKLGLKSQIKGSGLSFERLLYITDVITEKKHYVLFVNSKGIKFSNLDQLYLGLSKIIEQEIENVNAQVEYLQDHMKTDLVCDKATIHYELDDLGNKENKLYKTFDKIKKNIEKQKNNYC